MRSAPCHCGASSRPPSTTTRDRSTSCVAWGCVSSAIRTRSPRGSRPWGSSTTPSEAALVRDQHREAQLLIGEPVYELPATRRRERDAAADVAVRGRAGESACSGAIELSAGDRDRSLNERDHPELAVLTGEDSVNRQAHPERAVPDPVSGRGPRVSGRRRPGAGRGPTPGGAN